MTVFLLYETDTIQKTRTLIDIYGDKERMLYDMEKFKKVSFGYMTYDYECWEVKAS